MKVRLARKAFADLSDIETYLIRHFPEKEEKTRARLRSIFEQLTQFPQIGHKGKVSGTREYNIPGLPYLIVYRVQEDELQILRIFHGARNPSQR
jgi:addiction module RelE/StbE family toxin